MEQEREQRYEKPAAKRITMIRKKLKGHFKSLLKISKERRSSNNYESLCQNESSYFISVQ